MFRMTDDQLLAIRRFITSKAQTAAPTFEVFSSGVDFTGKESFWSNTGAGLDTQKTIETTLVNAIWVEWLNFADTSNNPNISDDGEDDAPITTRIYQLTVFCENGGKRYTEDNGIVQQDSVYSRLLSVDFRIESAVNALVTEFRGVTTINALGSGFAVKETNSLYMQEYVERDAVCDFIPGKKGRQVKLIVPVKVQPQQC